MRVHYLPITAAGRATVPGPTVRELIDRLSDHDPNAVVRMAVNPDFPFAHLLGDIAKGTDEDGRSAVFLAEAGQQGYLPRSVAEDLT